MYYQMYNYEYDAVVDRELDANCLFCDVSFYFFFVLCIEKKSILLKERGDKGLGVKLWTLRGVSWSFFFGIGTA